jgi:threonine dehydrogenase-like Zn-dependent dehydrogenase
LRKGTFIKKIPDAIGDSLASTINCALATMINCTDQIPVHMRREGRKALVQGDGMLGLYGCALLKELGFSTVYCSGLKSNRSVLIEEFGAYPLDHGNHILNQYVESIDINSRNFPCSR